ncbi:MAG: helix-turn-helix domain-containing protein [Acetobacteraceae bacterium]|nr:helix-turn-helix domain-containing protein [Acetobacteraceae bacterium]MDW8397060.1 IclR family transcriptional regulator C-terminal domain-containing protein [Acetobacteraceae bacterium]
MFAVRTEADFAPQRDYVTALARGLSVLRGFAGLRGPVGLAELARRVGLPRATVRRALITLRALGYVEEADGAFRLSAQVLTLAEAYLSSALLPRVAQPVLDRLSESVGESCSVSILQGEDAIYVARSRRRRPGSLHRDVGTRLPAHCTSMGRVLLAALPPAGLDAFFRRARPHRYTPRTLVEEVALRAAIAEAGREGYALVEGELEPDLTGLAVPVRNAAGEVVAALNVGLQGEVPPRRVLLSRLLPALREAAAEMRPMLIG